MPLTNIIKMLNNRDVTSISPAPGPRFAEGLCPVSHGVGLAPNLCRAGTWLFFETVQWQGFSLLEQGFARIGKQPRTCLPKIPCTPLAANRAYTRCRKACIRRG